MNNSKQRLYGLVTLAALTLITACETPEPKSSAANITQLTLTVGGEDKTVSFNDKREATLTHQYAFNQDAPTTATVKSISLSSKATATVTSAGTLAITNNKASITVTAEDGTKLTYTIAFTFTQQSPFTTLVLTIGSQDNEVTFDQTQQATVAYQYPFGGDPPTTATVKNISTADNTTASAADGEILTITDNQVTITVTAEDGTTQTYTLNFTFTIAASTAAAMTTLVLTLGGVDKTVTFNADRRDTVNHQVPFGTALPTQATVREIALSQGATATVASNETLAIAEDNTATITVTAEDGTAMQTYTLFFELTQAPDPITLPGVVISGSIPTNLSAYSEVAQAVLAPYTAGATVVTNYVTVAGAGTKDGSSWDNAADAENLKSTLDGIGDASSDKVYLLLVAAGSYRAGRSLSMKDNVAIVGGWEPTGGWTRVETDTTVFSGKWGRHQVINNSNLSHAAVLYGVKITQGSGNGGGMYNDRSSPTLTNVTFSENLIGLLLYGGGMYNSNGSSPILTNVTFSGNEARFGGGMFNQTSSSPTLTNVTFSENNANGSFLGGGGMYNDSSSPTLTNVTFSGNEATFGGGMFNHDSSPSLTNVTFFGNTATKTGGGMHNDNSSPVVVNSIFWGNTASSSGPQIAQWSGGTVAIYNSVLQGDTTAIHASDGSAFSTTNLVTTNPFGSITLADNGGSVQTVAIASGSTAQNIGVYVRRGSDGTFYYSEDNSTWYTSITAEGLADTATPPADAVDLTATDATGTARSGRPDAGAYEAR